MTWLEPWEPVTVTGTGVREAYTPGPPTTWHVGATTPFATDALAAKLPSCRRTKRRVRSVARRLIREGCDVVRVDLTHSRNPEEVRVSGYLPSPAGRPRVCCCVNIGYGQIRNAWVHGDDMVPVQGNGDREVRAAIVQARMKSWAWMFADCMVTL